MRLRSFLPLAVLALGAAVAACDTGEAPSLYDPIANGTLSPRPDPVLTGVTPAPGEPTIGGNPVAGLTTLVLTGSNFNPSPESTFVYLGTRRVPIVSVTPTQITVVTPNAPATDVPIRVSVLRAVNFSQSRPVTVRSAFERWGALIAANQPFGVATDFATRTGYVSLNEAGASQGLLQVTGPARPTQVVTTTFQWPDLAHFDGQLYAVRGVQAVFRFAIPSTTQQVWHNFGDAAVSLRALDIDAQGNVWTGGAYTGTNAARRAFYRVTQAKVVTSVPFEGEVTALEVSGGFVYVAGLRGTTRAVWRYPLSGDAVGAEEEYVRLSGAYANAAVTAIAVTASGELLLGTDAVPDPVLRVRTDRTVTAYYAGLLRGAVTAMRWVDATHLLISGVRIVGNADSEKATAGDLVLADAFQTAAP